ncbi:MAG: hypothetical protein ABIR94_08630, partial [Rubrivivax sp.]
MPNNSSTASGTRRLSASQATRSSRSTSDTGTAGGLYYDTTQRGLGSERRVSIEYFQPDGIGNEWHADAGLRTHGNSSRDHGFTPKHPLR